MQGKDDFEPTYELTDEDREMLADEERERMAEIAAHNMSRSRPARRVVPSVKFYDAMMCYRKGEWDLITEDLRRRYVMILRRSANANTFCTSETRNIATEILQALGLPAESEKKQRDRLKEREELSEQNKRWLDKSRRRLVDRQKRLMMERVRAADWSGFIGIVNPGPYQEQAIDELVKAGDLVIVGDEMVKIEKGRPPFDGSPRRERRVVRIGTPPVGATHTEPATAPVASDDEDLI